MAHFLTDRSQKVKIRNYLSQSGNQNEGVPHGTLLGPKCFLAYIIDLHVPCIVYKYVDDTAIFEVCHINGISTIQAYINIATEWISKNDMKINPDKSKEMTICFAHHVEHLSDMSCLTVDRMPVQNVTHAKLLGVTISRDLTRNRHVDNIIAKAGKKLYMLCHHKRASICQTDLVTV